jgi:hypothetical protein
MTTMGPVSISSRKKNIESNTKGKV